MPDGCGSWARTSRHWTTTQATLLRRRSVGFVSAFHVLPYLTVAQNVALPLDLLGVGSSERLRRTAEMLEGVGIAALAGRYARELSGGEVQRVAIARALVHKPRLILADEPNGNLDPRSAAQTLNLLRSQIKASAAAGLLITHSRAAAETADRILTLDARGLHRVEQDREITGVACASLGAGARQPARLAVTVFAIALGVALGTAVYLVNATALNEFGLAAKRLVGEADIIVRGPREGFWSRCS